MEPLRDPGFLAWMGLREAKGYKIVALDTTTELCTGAAKEIIEKTIKKSVVKSMSGMPESPPEKFVLPLSQWANKALKVRFVIIDFISLIWFVNIKFHRCSLTSLYSS
jgi:hypothetical protein